MELDNIFSSSPKSVYGVISDPGACYYMPAYQRPYSWNKKNVTRLMHDIKSGVESLHNADDAITFLGALLTVTDKHGESVEPKESGQLPTAVRLVIDGQQRLSTILLLCTRLYEKLALLKQNLEKEKSDALDSYNENEEDENAEKSYDFLSEQVDRLNQTLSRLRFFVLDTNSELDKQCRYYPKVIRGLVDCWGKKKKVAKYDSPLAHYLFTFNNNIIKAEKKEYKQYDLQSLHDEKFAVITGNIKELDKQLNLVESGKCWSEEGVVELSLLKHKHYAKGLNFEVADLIDFYGENISNALSKSIYLQLFTSYLLERVCVTFVAVTSENYAFDMFEALNTTGEPLTAYETFRPKVIEHLQQTIQESHCPDLDVIDGYLNSISNAEQKQKATQKVVEAFSYAQKGKSCGNHISNQRTYLISSFKHATPSREEYLSLFSSTVDFIFKSWLAKEEIDFHSIQVIDNEYNQERACLELLIDTGHDISRALLVYFYHDLLKNNNEEAKATFNAVIKMLAAFWVIRRAGTVGTDGIDAVYKKIYANIIIKEKCRKTALENIRLIIVNDLKSKFITSKEQETDLKAAWISKAKTNPIYTNGKQIGICRFLLLSSMHNTVMNDTDKSRLIKGKEGTAPLLTYSRWLDFKKSGNSQFTIEHIAPQTFINTDWDSSLDENKLVDTIGNLVILPRGDNAEASNKDWHSKLELYKKLTEKNSSVNEKAYLNFLEPLTNVKGLWKRDSALTRAEDMLARAWDNLAGWISPKI